MKKRKDYPKITDRKDLIGTYGFDHKGRYVLADFHPRWPGDKKP